jgi:hypothetical protein
LRIATIFILHSQANRRRQINNTPTAAAGFIEPIWAVFIRDWSRVAVQGLRGLAVNIFCSTWIRAAIFC